MEVDNTVEGYTNILPIVSMYLGVIMSILTTIIIATLCVFLKKNKQDAKIRWRRRKKSADANSFDANFAQRSIDNIDYDTISADEDDDMESSTMPMKPKRKKNVSSEASYENIYFGKTSNQQKKETEYDHVNLRAPSVNSANNAAQEERNVYAHAVADIEEAYDTVKYCNLPQPSQSSNNREVAEVYDSSSKKQEEETA